MTNKLIIPYSECITLGQNFQVKVGILFFKQAILQNTVILLCAEFNMKKSIASFKITKANKLVNLLLYPVNFETPADQFLANVLWLLSEKSKYFRDTKCS